MLNLAHEIAETFGLGSPRSSSPVPGGLSNDLWKLETERGEFAVKVMRTNASSPDFRDNVEAAFVVEANAFRQEVPCPEPVSLSNGRCLAEVRGQLIRVHRWLDGQPARPSAWLEQVGGLVGQIHAVGEPFDHPLDDEPWDVAGWASLADHADMPSDLADRLRRAAPDLASLEAVTAAPGLMTVHALSHRDLDPKNTLVVRGTLMALDWDAAGPQSVVREAVSVALDWSTDVDGFRRVVRSYGRATGTPLTDDPWVFGGWVSALGGWLVHNATARPDSDLGRAQVTLACDRLLALHASLEVYRQALASPH